MPTTKQKEVTKKSTRASAAKIPKQSPAKITSAKAGTPVKGRTSAKAGTLAKSSTPVKSSTSAKSKLPDNVFAFPKDRKEPLTDAKHVRDAIARFDQVEGPSDSEKDAAWKRIIKSAKKFDVKVGESDWRELGHSIKSKSVKSPTAKRPSLKSPSFKGRSVKSPTAKSPSAKSTSSKPKAPAGKK